MPRHELYSRSGYPKINYIGSLREGSEYIFCEYNTDLTAAGRRRAMLKGQIRRIIEVHDGQIAHQGEGDDIVRSTWATALDLFAIYGPTTNRWSIKSSPSSSVTALEILGRIENDVKTLRSLLS